MERDETATTAYDEDRALRELGFGSATEEFDLDRLEIEGELPGWLSGTLLRSGVSQFEGDGWAMRHWFDGLAMLHAFTFRDGQVSYRNRMLRSRAYEGTLREGRPVLPEFGTDPCRTLFRRVQATFHPEATDNAAVTINRLGDEYVAMTEAPMPVQFDPRTLATLAVDHRSKAPGSIATAHAHLDTGSGGMLNYALKVGRRSRHRFYVVGPRGRARVVASAPADPPRYVHSFGVTDELAVLLLGPLVLDPVKLATAALARRSFIECFDWRPELGTQLIAVDRASGETVAEHRAEAMFSFHHVNCFRRGDELVVDVCAYDDNRIVDALYLDRLRTVGVGVPVSTLRRLTLDLRGGGTRTETIWPGELELPRINYAMHNGRDYRFAYGATFSGRSRRWFSALAKVDVATGEAVTWSEPGLFPSEPVYVRRPGATDEDDGVVVSIGLDARCRRSELTVLDARTFTAAARVVVPHAIPYGFHSYHHRELD